MKLTREQAMNRQKQAPANWNYDIQYAVIHGEHTIVRKIKLDEQHYLTAKMIYRTEYETKTNEYGCKWNVETGRQIPNVHISKWVVPEGRDYATSNGLGLWLPVGEPQKNKNYKVLCQLAADITDEQILKWSEDGKSQLDNASIF